MTDFVYSYETKVGFGSGGIEHPPTLVRTHHKEPPLVILGSVAMVQMNSNGEHVMPTISAVELKGPQAQKDRGGGYILAVRRDT